VNAPNRDGWIELNDYCQKYGERRNTVHKRVADGTWPRGEFYSSPSGSVSYVHEARAREWLEQQGKLREGL
jgi:predicted DNA-binding transcriptional regulator AlpA